MLLGGIVRFREPSKRFHIILGIAGAFVFTTGWVAASLAQTNSYSWSRQEISDLGALTANHPWIWNIADSISGLLLVLFSQTLAQLTEGVRFSHISSTLIGVVGLGSILDGIFREDCPLSTSPWCRHFALEHGLSWHHQAHDIESIAVGAALLLAPIATLFMIRNRGSIFFYYTLGTVILSILAASSYGVLYGKDGGGICQRLVVTFFMAWIIVLSISSARRLPGWCV